MNISKDDLEDLSYAKSLLANPSLAARITNLLGTSIEKGFELLPEKWSEVVQEATKALLQKALDLAIMTMDDKKSPSSDTFHKLFVLATGADGGALGLPALAVELPVSTSVMLRSIADIARSEGEKIKVVETKLTCLEVFALGGRPRSDDGTETGYYAVRAALARAVSEAAKYIAERGLVEEGAPAVVRLIAAIAARFGIVVTQKAAAQAVPAIGGAGGTLINTIFIDHFQDIARGHFIIRRLERTYGQDIVQRQYETL